MKKLISILTICLVLLSGMHVSVANHICQGKYVASKVSFDKEKAGCGMASDFEKQSHNLIIKNKCCENHILSLNVDSQYQPTSFQVKFQNLEITNVFIVPNNDLLSHCISSFIYLTNALPLGNLMATDVSLSRICTYRI